MKNFQMKRISKEEAKRIFDKIGDLRSPCPHNFNYQYATKYGYVSIDNPQNDWDDVAHIKIKFSELPEALTNMFIFEFTKTHITFVKHDLISGELGKADPIIRDFPVEIVVHVDNSRPRKPQIQFLGDMFEKLDINKHLL